MTEDKENVTPEEPTFLDKLAEFAGEMSGDHDTSDEIEEIKQYQGYTSSEG